MRSTSHGAACSRRRSTLSLLGALQRGAASPSGAVPRHLRARIAQPFAPADLLSIRKSRRYCRRRPSAKTSADLTRRIASHATEFLNRVAETATARGVVVVAGYDPELDWLPLDALLAPLSEQAGLKVLWFGAAAEHASDIADEMIAVGSLVSTPTTLASAISELELEGEIDFAGSAAPDEPGMVSITQGVLDITPALRLRVEASAAIVDDQWTEEPEPLDGPAPEEAFRRFHGDLGGFRPLIEGVARGFAIERDFEADLWKTFGTVLRRLSRSDGVVIVHGQSGAGKSIAVARLALKIRRQLRLPVVVTTSRIPTYADIDAFCSEAERAGASASVLVCDASQTPQRYRDLATALQSRGRRLLIVGTSYRIDERFRGGSRDFVEAPANISAAGFRTLKLSVQLRARRRTRRRAHPRRGRASSPCSTARCLLGVSASLRA